MPILLAAISPWHEDDAAQHYLGKSLAGVVVGMAAEATQGQRGQKAAYLAERAVHRNVLRRAIAARMQVFAGRRAKGEKLRVTRLCKSEVTGHARFNAQHEQQEGKYRYYCNRCCTNTRKELALNWLKAQCKARCKDAQCVEITKGEGVNKTMEEGDRGAGKMARLATAAGGLTAGKRSVHAPHRVAVTHGLARCQGSGSYASISLCTRPGCKQLVEVCRAPTKAGSYCLARLAQGKAPRTDVACWPDGTRVGGVPVDFRGHGGS